MNIYINDLNSVLIGNVLFRQVRVERESCKMSNIIKDCYQDYGLLSQDDRNYNISWNPNYDSNYIPPVGSEKFYESFEYKSAFDIDSFPYFGIYGNYLGGGYVYRIDTSENMDTKIRQDLNLLQTNKWIDQHTRAIFIEFTLYNPNLNLFVYCTILFEHLPTGNLLNSFLFNPFYLYENPSFGSLLLVFEIIYLVIIVFFMIKEIKSIIKLGIKHSLKQFWFYIDWLLIVFTWVSVAMYAYRLYAKYELEEKLRDSTKPINSKMLNLQTISYWNDLLVICVSICSFIGTLKFMKLLRFSRNISLLTSTLKSSLKELLQFVILFLILWFAFVQLMFLYFYDNQLGFNTIIKSIETTFQIILGKFDISSYLSNNYFLAPFLFIFYNLLIVIVLINVFISIISANFSKSRQEKLRNKRENELTMLDYLKQKIFSFLNMKKKAAQKENQSIAKYNTGINSFNQKANNLINKITNDINYIKEYQKLKYFKE